MSNFDNVNLSTNRELLQKDENAVEQFGRAALYSGLQVPVNGAAQLLDRATGTNILPSVQLIDAPAKDSLAANLGSITASAGHCALMLATAHKIVGPAGGLHSLEPLDAVKAIGQRSLVAGGLGAVYGGVFSPVSNDGDFLKGRLANAGSGAAGLSVMSGFSSFYRELIGKDVLISEAPAYKLLIPPSFAGIGVGADETFNGPTYGGRSNTVFLPGGRLRPIESYLKK